MSNITTTRKQIIENFRNHEDSKIFHNHNVNCVVSRNHRLHTTSFETFLLRIIQREPSKKTPLSNTNRCKWRIFAYITIHNHIMIHNRILITTINMRISKYALRINQHQPMINRSKSNVMLTNSICSLHNHSINIRTINVGKDGKKILNQI